MLENNKINGKVDHRIRVSKLLIRQAFLNLLKEKPLRKVSVKEICEKAQLNRGTFYSYYLDVYDLLNKIEEEMIKSFENVLEDLINKDNFSVGMICYGVFEVIKQNGDLCSAIFSQYGDRSFTSKLIEIGRKKYFAKYTKTFPNTTRKKFDTYYTFVAMGCMGLVIEWVKDDLSTKVSTMAENAESIMMKGIGFLIS